MTTRSLLLGPPGCGKTERLLIEMERSLHRGVSPGRIAFVSFTRAAVREARARACEKFKLVPDDLPNFRTLHSLAFRGLNLRRGDVLDRSDLARLEEITGEEITGHHELDAPTLGERGDALLFLDQTSRAAGLTLEEMWHRHGAAIDWRRLERFVGAYHEFRRDSMKIDFTDMLEAYVGRGVGADLDRFPMAGAPADVDDVFLDEAQDLSPLQWRVAERAFGSAENLWVAGDDDQAIYAWAGADATALLDFEGRREVLGQSFRLPRAVHALAAEVASTIERRNSKAFAPRDDEGAVEWVRRIEEVDLSTGNWLLLARTRRQLAPLTELARGQGVTYSVMGESAVDAPTVHLIRTWEALRAGRRVNGTVARRLREARAVPAGMPLEEDVEYSAADLGLTGELPIWHDALTGVPVDDREYLLSCLRRGERLLDAPRVRVSTIHGAKGAEADHVLLLTDVPARVWRGMELDPDAEARVLYVAVTRARQALTIVAPRGRMAYQL